MRKTALTLMVSLAIFSVPFLGSADNLDEELKIAQTITRNLFFAQNDG